MTKHTVLFLLVGWLVGLFFPPTIVTNLLKGAAGAA